MNANEVLYRLAEQARASLGDFVSLRGGLPFFDLDKAEAAGKMHLIKRLRVTDKSLDIELHDAQAALIHLLRELTLKGGAATDKLKIEVEYVDDYERAERISTLLDTARARRDAAQANGHRPALPADELDNIFS